MNATTFKTITIFFTLIFCTTASFGAILITDGSFEGTSGGDSVINVDTDLSDNTSGWFEETNVVFAEFSRDNSGSAPDAADGTYWGALTRNGGFYQAIGDYEQNLDITIDFFIGSLNTQNTATHNLELWVGGTVGNAADGASLGGAVGATLVDTFAFPAAPSNGNTSAVSANFDTGTVGINGQTLWLRIDQISGGGAQTTMLVDDFSITNVPEPNSLLLILGTGLALVIVRKKDTCTSI